MPVREGRAEGPRCAARGLFAAGQRGDVRDRDRFCRDVLGPRSGLEEDPRRLLDVDDADRRPTAVVERQLLTGSREPAELVDDGLRLLCVVFDRTLTVDDSQPQDRKLEAVPPRLDRECLLAVDLREMGEIPLRSVWSLRPELAAECAAVDMQRRGEDEPGHAGAPD